MATNSSNKKVDYDAVPIFESKIVQNETEYNELLRKHAKIYSQLKVAILASLVIFHSGLFGGWFMGSIGNTSTDHQLFSEDRIALLSKSIAVGSLVGPWVFSFCLNRFGRKWTICLLFVPKIISSSVLYFNQDHFIATIITGFCESLTVLVGFTIAIAYVSETCSPHLRGSLGCITYINMTIGKLFGHHLAYAYEINVSAIILLTSALIFLLLSTLNVESPYYYLLRNQREKARESLQQLYNEEVVETELNRLIESMSDRGVKQKVTFIGLLKDPQYRISMSVLMLMFGCVLLPGYPSAILNSIYLNKATYQYLSPEISLNILAITGAAMNLVSIVLLRYFRRRVLYLLTVGLSAVSLVMYAIYFELLEPQLTDYLQTAGDFFPLTLFIIYSIARGLGIFSITHTYFRELVPAESLSVSTVAIDVHQAIMMAASMLLLDIARTYLSLAWLLGFLAAIHVICIVAFYTLIPETHNKTLEQIQSEMKANS